MIRSRQLIRLIKIFYTLMRYAINRPVLEGQSGWLRGMSYLNPLSFLNSTKSRGESIRLGLESLGPIFVKFGQILSTRHDLLPDDIAIELAKLQDQVPPFCGKKAREIIESALGQPIEAVFAEFNETPLASASIAQVHAAQLHDGSDVIVKVLRPTIKKVIRNDIALLYGAARMAEKLWHLGKRLRPVELVAEFEETLLGELDLMREAANASQLRRNFSDSRIMYVPKIYWPYTRNDIMVMERIHGVPIANVDELKAHGTNMAELAERGVTIFFTQVFRDSFFHADMHPGNLFVDITDPQQPKYLGVDFGIMGSIGPDDLHYLAENMLAFFHRDYRRIAALHIESGWVSSTTRVDQFETAIRTVSEPIFEKPLSEISFGQLLLKLFQTAERYNMVIQPQLLLLQKTLFNIEGLGRRLYPDLDLWKTAKPFMEDWAMRQKGLRKIGETFRQEWEGSMEAGLKTPQLLYDALYELRQRHRRQDEQSFTATPKNYPCYFWVGAGAALLGISGTLLAFHDPLVRQPIHLEWMTLAVGGVLCLYGLIFRRH